MTDSDSLQHPQPPLSWWAEMTDWGVLRLTGKDARKFLHSQGTADLAHLDSGHSLPYATLSLKGRVMELMHLLPWQDDVLLLMPRPCIPGYMQRMKPYLAFSQAHLEDVSSHWRVLISADAGDGGGILHQVTTSGRAIASWLDARHRLWACPDDEQPIELATYAPAEQTTGVAALINMGRAIITPPLQDHYLPQMLHLQVLQGLSFNKGCYTGQEVVARAWFRGQIKQSLHHYQAPVAGRHDVAAPILNSSLRPVGEILQAAACGDHLELLAVLRDESSEDELYLEDSPYKLQHIPLPYAITHFEHRQTE